MRLFFDEDMGKGVPEALRLVGLDTTHVKREFHYRFGSGGAGVPDEDWIPVAGSNGMLVISCNKGILEAEAQRNLWIQHRVGGVFFTTGGANRLTALKVLLRKMDWLETVHLTQPRPFAYLLTPSGRVRLDPRVRPAD